VLGIYFVVFIHTTRYVYTRSPRYQFSELRTDSGSFRYAFPANAFAASNRRQMR